MDDFYPSVREVHLSLNTTSLIQLMEQGVIATFKKYLCTFKKYYLCRTERRIRNNLVTILEGLLEISGEITPERMKGWSQSKNNTQLWM